MGKLNIRTGTQADLLQIKAIYDYYSLDVADTAVTFDTEPRSEAFMAEWFRKFGAGGRFFLFVAEGARGVLGYAYSGPFRHKPAYDSSVECSAYMAAGAVGKGIGTRLYEALFQELNTARVHRAYAWIALPNSASVRFHVRLGFERVGVLREVGFKFGRYWDVALYERGMGV